MIESPCVSVSQIAAELGIGVNVLGRWRRELCQGPDKAFVGHSRPRDEELTVLRRELARVSKERDFLREAAAFFLRESAAMKHRMIQRCRNAVPIRRT